MKSGVKQAILDGSGTVIGAMIMAFGTSLFITVCSVAVIILCTSMCAWYIIRVND